MKIRWNRSSLRLRITPKELEMLRNGEPIIEENAFWSMCFSNGERTELVQEGARVHFRLSSDDVTRLLEPTREGVYANQNGFKFFVEKDFPCQHGEAGDPADTFAVIPSPNAKV
jgi:hypothetical protein